MFAMVLLTACVFVKLFRTRLNFTRRGDIDVKYFKTYQYGGEPAASAKLARNFSNLFETPTLFYGVCLASMFANVSSVWMTVFAWSYFALRLAHSFVHGGSNRLRPRIATYFGSWAALLVMWAVLVVSVARLP